MTPIDTPASSLYYRRRTISNFEYTTGWLTLKNVPTNTIKSFGSPVKVKHYKIPSGPKYFGKI